MADSLDGRAVANYVLDFCDRRGTGVSHLALQKIVYFCHVWSLIELRRPLIRHKFEAWEFGPVLPYLYREFKAFDRAPIKGRATEIDPATGRKRIVAYNLTPDTEERLSKVVAFYSRMRAGDLVEMSHAEGGPWHKVWNHGGNANPGMKIDDSEIVNFYSRISCPFSVQ